MNNANRLLNLAEETLNVTLPIRLRAWDGSEAGVDGAPVLVITNKRALRHIIWKPGELAVALVGEENARVCRLYLAGGSLAFEENRMGVDQILAVKPSKSGVSNMPASPLDWLSA